MTPNVLIRQPSVSLRMLSELAGNGRSPTGVLDADMCAIHSKTADSRRQTCPNCKHTKMLKTARPDEEEPRKNYCTECGHEWWEFDKRPVVRPDSHGF